MFSEERYDTSSESMVLNSFWQRDDVLTSFQNAPPDSGLASGVSFLDKHKFDLERTQVSSWNKKLLGAKGIVSRSTDATNGALLALPGTKSYERSQGRF